MKYSIIGSGAIGQALAKHFAAAGINVMVSNSRGPESLAALADRLGPHIKPVTSVDALTADIVILAVPHRSVASATREVADWHGRIVVDATNAIDFPAFTPTDLGGRPSTEVIADALRGARVVKAFNTLPAALLAADSVSGPRKRVIFVAGNDDQANRTVGELVGRLGFAPLQLGELHGGGRLQEFGGPLMVHDLALCA